MPARARDTVPELVVAPVHSESQPPHLKSPLRTMEVRFGFKTSRFYCECNIFYIWVYIPLLRRSSPMDPALPARSKGPPPHLFIPLKSRLIPCSTWIQFAVLGIRRALPPSPPHCPLGVYLSRLGEATSPACLQLLLHSPHDAVVL